MDTLIHNVKTGFTRYILIEFLIQRCIFYGYFYNDTVLSVGIISSVIFILCIMRSTYKLFDQNRFFIIQSWPQIQALGNYNTLLIGISILICLIIGPTLIMILGYFIHPVFISFGVMFCTIYIDIRYIAIHNMWIDLHLDKIIPKPTPEVDKGLIGLMEDNHKREKNNLEKKICELEGEIEKLTQHIKDQPDGELYFEYRGDAIKRARFDFS